MSRVLLTFRKAGNNEIIEELFEAEQTLEATVERLVAKGFLKPLRTHVNIFYAFHIGSSLAVKPRSQLKEYSMPIGETIAIEIVTREGVLSGIEDKFENFIERPFQNLFGIELQPDELSKELEKALYNSRFEAKNNQTYVPSYYEIHFSPHDYGRFLEVEEKIRQILVDDLMRYSQEYKVGFANGTPFVRFDFDDCLAKGKFFVTIDVEKSPEVTFTPVQPPHQTPPQTRPPRPAPTETFDTIVFDQKEIANELNDKLKEASAVKDWSSVIEIGNQLISLGSDSQATTKKVAVAYRNRADDRREANQYQEAISDYTQAIKLDPKYAIAYRNRGQAYKLSGSKANARRDWQKAIELGDEQAQRELDKL